MTRNERQTQSRPGHAERSVVGPAAGDHRGLGSGLLALLLFPPARSWQQKGKRFIIKCTHKKNHLNQCQGNRKFNQKSTLYFASFRLFWILPVAGDSPVAVFAPPSRPLTVPPGDELARCDTIGLTWRGDRRRGGGHRSQCHGGRHLALQVLRSHLVVGQNLRTNTPRSCYKLRWPFRSRL